MKNSEVAVSQLKISRSHLLSDSEGLSILRKDFSVSHMYNLNLDKLTQVALPKLIAGGPAAL